MFFRILILLTALCLSSCSTTEVSTDRSIPMFVGAWENHSIKREIELTQEYYLWGLVPGKMVQKLDLILSKEGAVSAANTTVKYYQSWSDLLKTIFSLGFYCPMTLKIESFIQEVDK